jgi:hypothetical protein
MAMGYMALGTMPLKISTPLDKGFWISGQEGGTVESEAPARRYLWRWNSHFRANQGIENHSLILQL